MINYTHVFINSTRRMVPLEQAAGIILTAEVRSQGFNLADAAKVSFDRHGNLCRQRGGWSYGHVQAGYICAGAGGLSSMRVQPI
jgi:hypothetical protein